MLQRGLHHFSSTLGVSSVSTSTTFSCNSKAVLNIESSVFSLCSSSVRLEVESSHCSSFWSRSSRGVRSTNLVKETCELASLALSEVDRQAMAHNPRSPSINRFSSTASSSPGRDLRRSLSSITMSLNGLRVSICSVAAIFNEQSKSHEIRFVNRRCSQNIGATVPRSSALHNPFTSSGLRPASTGRPPRDRVVANPTSCSLCVRLNSLPTSSKAARLLISSADFIRKNCEGRMVVLGNNQGV